jgi:DNA (cytosine-5)-methyltransferase 1
MTTEAPGGPFAVSLFTGAGIGDLGFRAAGFHFLATCEIEKDRCALAALNDPDARPFAADVRTIQGPLVRHVRSRLGRAGQELFLLVCTAPCQGMSKNGQGTLLANVRKGKRPRLDPRNRLVLPALNIIRRLRPLWVVFENVIEMRHTVIADEQGLVRPILEVIQSALSPVYSGVAYDVEFADYGIPQRRQRLITIYTRDPAGLTAFRNGATLLPPRTHSREPRAGWHRWVSVAEALRGFPPLDAGDPHRATCSTLPFHRVPVLDPRKYEWVRHTPPSASAFDNQCANPVCGFSGNPTHGARHGRDGINRSNKDTPLFCIRCGSLLPRPYVEDRDGRKRIMSGYTSAYKRMAADLPAPALTRNLSYPCSDQKIHPFENRVLSLHEAMALQTVTEYPYAWGPLQWEKGGRRVVRRVASDSLIRHVLAESVPPRFFELLGRHLRELSSDSGLSFSQIAGR